MNNTILQPPMPINEPVRSYAPGSPERASLRNTLMDLRNEEHVVLPVIAGKRIETGRVGEMRPPHDHQHLIGTCHKARPEDVQSAIDAALEARHDWMRMDWTDRAAIFLKAAELLSGPFRDRMNAATMLGQSKNSFQAEIDAACEMVDFFTYNVHFMQQIYEDQPYSPEGVWNKVEYRPLEGFVFAVTPFNFTSIAANLAAAPAIMGNTVVWKPGPTQMFSANVIMELFEEAGLPPGVVNMVPGDGPDVGDPVLASEDLAGLHFTGSTATFQHLWKTIGANISSYKSYPRIVGETGGKDFIAVHESADTKAVATAILRGSFEYQGQKCSAASRMYVPHSLWEEVRDELRSQLEEVKMGPVEDFTNFVNAVIDQRAYDKITGYIERAKDATDAKIVAGGSFSDESGYFIEPTVIEAADPHYETMEQELFGPVASVYVMPESSSFDDMLELIDETSPYALTGAVFAGERAALAHATDRLADNAGNFYLNDKPTGAVVGQQPFGGARGSGTNDKAGSYVNLLRWTSLRSIKETFNPPHHFSYPFHQADARETQEVNGEAVNV